MKVEVYSRPGCKYCRLAKEKLKTLCIPYDDINIFDDDNDEDEKEQDSKREERINLTKTTTVPQIFIGNEHIGGYEELLRYIDAEKWKEWRKDAAIDEEENGPKKEFTVTTFSSNFLIPENGEALNNLKLRTHLLPLFPEYKSSSSAVELSQRFHNLSLQMVDLFASKSTNLISYNLLLTSETFLNYVLLSTEISRLNGSEISNFSDSEKLCFFVNVYNSLVIHGKCIFPPKVKPSEEGYLKETFDFFIGKTGVLYEIAGLLFTLDDIEHGILRANQPHPKDAGRKHYYFENSSGHIDTRSEFSLSRSGFDPRVHFVLNCGAKSCPPITFLSSSNLEYSLNISMKLYLQSEIILNEDDSTLLLPKLLLWYGIDFGKNIRKQFERIFEYLADFLTQDSALLQLYKYLRSSEFSIDQKGPEYFGKFKIEWKAYDWSLNKDEGL